MEEIKEGEILATEASLIIGLQNYAKSGFIGSNIKDNYSSKLFPQPFLKAEAMPACFRENQHATILLAKVLENLNGPELEVELQLDKQLFKITDLTESAIRQWQKQIKKWNRSQMDFGIVIFSSYSFLDSMVTN